MPTLLPEPDSPTIPSASPVSSVMLTPSTARTSPFWDGNATDRFSISRSGIRSTLVPCLDSCLKTVHSLGESRAATGVRPLSHWEKQTEYIVAFSTRQFLFNNDHALSLELGIERIAQSVAQKVEGQHGQEDRQARKRDDPPSPQHEFARVRQHGSPLRQGRLRTETEKAERGRVHDRGRNAERRLYDQGRCAIRQHLLEHQPEPAGARDFGRGDVILRDFADHGRTRDPHVMRQE